MLQVLIIADALDKLNPKTDTGLAFLRAGLERKHSVSWATSEDVFLKNHRAVVQTREILRCEEDALPSEFSQEREFDLTFFHSIWIRKDPPLDDEYLSLCWLLSLVERQVSILNSPQAILLYPEKLLPWIAFHEGFLDEEDLIDTQMLTPLRSELRGMASAEIFKPFFGHGGIGITKSKTPPAIGRRMLAQPFLPEVQTQGDRRVFFLGGRYFGDVTRIPSEGGFLSNLSQGGVAKQTPLSESERELILKLERFLQTKRLAFVGADFLAGRCSEINITAPTGVQALRELTQDDLASAFVGLAEKDAKR